MKWVTCYLNEGKVVALKGCSWLDHTQIKLNLSFIEWRIFFSFTILKPGLPFKDVIIILWNYYSCDFHEKANFKSSKKCHWYSYVESKRLNVFIAIRLVPRPLTTLTLLGRVLVIMSLIPVKTITDLSREISLKLGKWLMEWKRTKVQICIRNYALTVFV